MPFKLNESIICNKLKSYILTFVVGHYELGI